VIVYGASSFYTELEGRIFNRALLRDWSGIGYLDLTAATDTRGYAVGDTTNAHVWASPDNGGEDPVRRQLDKFTATNPREIRVMHNQFRALAPSRSPSGCASSPPPASRAGRERARSQYSWGG
jgi:hypothetical protein